MGVESMEGGGERGEGRGERGEGGGGRCMRGFMAGKCFWEVGNMSIRSVCFIRSSPYTKIPFHVHVHHHPPTYLIPSPDLPYFLTYSPQHKRPYRASSPAPKWARCRSRRYPSASPTSCMRLGSREEEKYRC